MDPIDVKTAEMVAAFSGNADGLALSIRDWYRLFPQSFYRIARARLIPARDVFVFRLMLADPGCSGYLCDPALLDLSDALDLAHNFSAVAADLDVRLAHSAVEWVGARKDPKILRRCVVLLHSLAPGPRINGALVQLLMSHDGAVRSKVFELLIRSSLNEHNIHNWLRDPDPRIRANLTEFLSRLDPLPEWVRQILLEHLPDACGRIAANCAVGLFRMGYQREAVGRLREMADDQTPSVRSSAAWAMGQILDADHGKILKQLRSDSDAHVRWNALRSLSKMRRLTANAVNAPEP